ncbi:MAG: DUF1194 domain-containing protein [Rhodobacter sp.]|nr:DUF1194 domain-containing protein [Rhodobacter sp.]
MAECRLALALALDISSSVDQDEDRLQRIGLANALASPQVQAAILSVPGETVALAVFEWSGRYQQDITLTWRVLASRADILAAASEIRRSRRRYAEFPTALGYALGFAASVFADAPRCLFKTLDVSGDGVNNDGFAPRLAYENFPLDEVTVNGLSIGGQEDDLAGYYRRELIKGPGAFVEEAADFHDFERAIRRKLVRELETRAIGWLPQPGQRGG